ncbi:MAG TPA: hypothetical protein VKB93_02410 [Thermoanaerobaculia bacterium]|nr:hypothetical protein [Thermoanaerobaculia bacterium]
MLRRRLSFVAACILAALAVFPATNPVHERGFRSDAVYQFNGLDSVSLFNGNLTLAIPMGASYPVGPGLSYSFVLRYSGNVWKWLEWERFTNQEHGDHQPTGHTYDPENENAGLGWRLEFGELSPPSCATTELSCVQWKYKTSDGAEHYFFNTLHDPPCSTASVCDPYNPTAAYTRDGSYLRLRQAAPSVRIVEFPNGERHRFEPNNSGWHLTFIYNAFSTFNSDGTPATNYVRFELEPQSATIGEVPYTWNDWKITDSHNRKHFVRFSPAPRIHVTSVELAAFNDTRATYTLEYEVPQGQTLPNTALQMPCPNPPSGSTKNVTLLSRIVLPNNEEDFRLTYYQPAGVNCLNDPLGADHSGLLASLRLPTYGSLNWTYAQYVYSGISEPAIGVKARSVKDANQTEVERTEYGVELGKTTVTTCGAITNGVCKADSRAVHYYMADFASTEFGLPFTKAVRSTGPVRNPDPMGRFLSSETFDCDPANNACDATPKRAAYVRYEMDYQPAGTCHIDFPCARDRNRRVVSERTLFVDDTAVSADGPAFADTDYDDFDGLGHYRRVIQSGFTKDDPKRVAFTNYNATLRDFSTTTWTGSSVGTYALDAFGARKPGFTMPAVSDPWVLNTFTDASVTERDATVVSRSCFDVTNGFLRRGRLLKGMQDGPTDLVKVYEKNSFGFTASERSYGGDWTPLSTLANFCKDDLPASGAAFRIDHTYEYGVPASARYVKPDGTAVEFFSADNTIDRDTGLVQSARDVSGLATTFVYDASGRLTAVTLPASTSQAAGGAPTTYTYTAATASRRAAVDVRAGSSSNDSASLISKFEFDALGRVARESQRMPDGTNSARVTEYDPAGRRKSASEWDRDDATQFHRTIFGGYDPFGRPGNVTAPDQSVTSYAYTGVRLVTRSAIGGGMTPVTSAATETYDRYGRLVSVQDNSGGNGQLLTTTYTYDVANHLSTVRMRDSDGAIQNRIFSYDGRGLLQWESHPESGMKAYTYDAGGHVITSEVGAAKTMFDLKYAYDAAERLTLISGRKPSNPDAYRPLKEFLYGQNNDFASSPPSYQKGKLLTAVRYNYMPDQILQSSPASKPDVRITELYFYRDAAGRRTGRSTLIEANRDHQNPNWELVRDIDQSMIYDEHGQTTTALYPTCVDCGAPPSDPRRGLRLGYANGRLTSVKNPVQDLSTAWARDFVKSISYWPNGMRKQILHDNDMADEQTADGGMARPGSLQVGQYHRCEGAAIADQTVAAVKSGSQPVQLSVTATGTGPIFYQWYDFTQNYTLIPGATGSTFTPSPSADSRYVVEVWNSCRKVQSKTITVKVGACVPAWIEDVTAIKNVDGTYTLRAWVGGSGTVNYFWTRSSDGASMGSGVVSGSSVSLGPLTLSAVTGFVISATNPSCSTSAATRSVSAGTSPALAAMTLTASQIASDRIRLQWNPLAGVRYLVSRRSAGESMIIASDLTATSYDDTAVIAGRAYAYQVTAVSIQNNALTSTSNTAVTTTLTFSLIRPRETEVAAGVFNELLTGLNAVRAIAGWSAVSWSNILAPTDPLPSPGTIVTGRQIMAIRTRLNEAMQALGAPIAGYTDPDLQGAFISAHHVTDIQDRMR